MSLATPLRLTSPVMPANPLTDPNWATETTETVVRLVGTVRDKTTTPVIRAARGLVFGVVAAFIGTFAAVVLLIALIRALQALLDLGMSHAQAVYASYFIIGGIFCAAGLLLFKRRGATA